MTQEQKEKFKAWKERLSGRFVNEDDFDAVIAYVASLLEHDLPVIIGINHLAGLMGINENTLKRMVVSSHSFYRSFSIPKRKGGTREIDAPYPSMLRAQSWIYEQILSKLRVSDVAMGFVPKRSIIDNAFAHKGKESILMMDVKDFFPSIKWYKVYAVFKHIGYPKNISQYLASICCLNGSLPQGAVTSPCLSNIICRRLDTRISNLAKKFKVTYTRYADDVTFSGGVIPTKFYFLVSYIFDEEGFEINPQKTRFIRGQHKKIVTGLSVSTDKLTVPKYNRRQIRQEVYYIRKYGLKSHQNYIGNNDPIYLKRLIGYLNFWKNVEPSNKFVAESLKFLNNCLASISMIDIGNAPTDNTIHFDEYSLQFDEPSHD